MNIKQSIKDLLYPVLNKKNTAFLPAQFYFIKKEVERQFKCYVFPEKLSPLKKRAIINKGDYYVLIDCSDGVRDDLDIMEYSGFLYKFLSLAKPKKFFLFRMNYSPSKSKNIENLAKENNGIILQCLPWSYYKKSYLYFFKNRFSLREKILKTPKKYNIIFYGNLNNYYYPAPYKNGRKLFKYPISAIEAKQVLGRKVSKENLNKQILLKSRKDYWDEIGIKEKTKFSKSVPFDAYVRELTKTKLNFCPPGIGHITHKVYKNVAIGVSSLIPESSYNLPYPLNLEDIGIVYKGRLDFLKKYKDFIEKNRFEEMHQKCIDIYEKYLTPKNIVSDIINKIRRYK